MYSIISRNAARNIDIKYMTLIYPKYFSSKKVPLPENVIGDVYSAVSQETNGEIYDKKPFKLRLEAGKRYNWCLCGRSHTQPLCDQSHRDIYVKVKQKPISFVVNETKDYWLCNCKQTKRRPFCDGTHKQQFVQEANVKV